MPDTYGPVAIIVTPFADGVSEILRETNNCLKHWYSKVQRSPTSGITRKIVTESYGRAAHDETINELLMGTGILVVTPPALARWINLSKVDKVEGLPLFNKKRLKIFAVDDFDKIFTRYGSTICEQIETFCGKKVVAKQTDGKEADGEQVDDKETDDKRTKGETQLLITSSQWLPQLNKYCQFGKSPALYIANYIEASVYGQTQFRLNFVESAAKLQIVEQFLGDDIYKTKRSLIVCTNDEEITQICDHLRNANINYTSFTQDTDEANRNSALSWHETPSTDEFTVLVCSDAVLGDLSGMKNAQRLLNYSLPDHWSTLSQRFAVFFDTFHDFVQRPKSKEPESPFAQILVGETDCRTLPRFVDFLTRVNGKVPEEVHTIARNMLQYREGEQASFGLCPFFLHYGIKLDECSRNKCRGRHALSSFDAPTERMPAVNTVLKLKITVVHNPIHFSGQILAYRRRINEPIWHDWQDKNQITADADLKFQLQTYYSNDDNKIKHYPLNKGDICAIDDTNYFHRVQILQIDGKSGVDTKLMVTVRFIDTGEIYTKKFVRDMYILPEHLKSIPPRAIDIHNVGIVPYDADLFWSRRAKLQVEKVIEHFNKKVKGNAEFYVKSSVHFRVENNVWTEEIKLCEPLIDDQVREIFLHSVLLKEKLAERADDFPQLDILKEMAKDLGKF